MEVVFVRVFLQHPIIQEAKIFLKLMIFDDISDIFFSAPVFNCFAYVHGEEV